MKYNLTKLLFTVFVFLLLAVIGIPSKSQAYSYTVSLIPGCTTTTGTNTSGISCSSQTMIKFTDSINTKQERIDVQKVLNKVLVPSPNLTLDGIIFGTKTINAIKTLQIKYGLKADGRIGTLTRTALEQAQIDYYNNVTPPVTTCSNGAINPPDCTTFNPCTNGAINPPTCNAFASTVDTVLPAVSSFTIPSTSISLTVSILSLTATDNVGVTGYYVSESSNIPTTSSTWLSSVPSSYNFSSSGAKTLYAWARDAAGNVSNSLSSSVTITLVCSGSATQSCAITNGIGTQLRTCTNGVWSTTYGTCTVASCNTNYTQSGNTCIAVTPPQTGTGKTYYVSSSTGSDSYTSTQAQSSSTPWKTIAKVNSQTFSPGDSILFKRGDVWREGLKVNSSGTSASRITYSSYGTGNKPQILGSTKAITWSNVSGNIWVSATTLIADSGSVVFDQSGVITWGNAEKTYQAGFGNLTTEYDWTWYNNQIYVYSPTDPNTRYSAVEVFNPSPGHIGINTYNKEYITFDGLDIRYWAGIGIYENYYSPMPHLHGLTVRNCDISYIGNQYTDDGSAILTAHSDSQFDHNVIHDTGRRGLSINDYQAGTGLLIENVVVEYNTFYSGSHTTSVDIIAHGEQLCTFNNITIRNNLIYESPMRSSTFADTLLFVSKQGAAGGSVISNTYIYDNIFEYPSGVGLHLQNNKGTYIFNNVFYGTNPVSTQVSSGYKVALEGTETDNVNIKNNIFYGTANAPAISKNGEITGLVVSDYNLFYNTSPSSYIVRWDSGYYSTNQWSVYKTASGQDAHSPNPSNPLFIDATNGNFHLQSGSPAIGKGVFISGMTKDYDGVNYNNPPSIGAYEYGGVLGTSIYHFTLNLKYGSTGNEVMELQKLLLSLGYLKVTPNGNFGPATLSAVKEYQKANDLMVDGIVGQRTRNKLNK